MKETDLSPFTLNLRGSELSISVFKYILNFNFAARTSRGSIAHKPTYFVKINRRGEELTGVGECSPLAGLSPEYDKHYEIQLEKFCRLLANASNFREVAEFPELKDYPSIRFGFEMAVKDLTNGGKKVFFDNSFSKNGSALPINGLVWMGDFDFMLKQLEVKLAAGFTCIKMKIGGIAFQNEVTLLKRLRQSFSANDITIRLDANGAFSPKTALQKLEELANFDVHSIEQPIKQGQIEEMADICKKSPIPIALDEELIGIKEFSTKGELLDAVSPQYIILKPSLVGGFKASTEWITLAEERNIDWWITSALESNIGLNAIAQFTANHNVTLPQGLGTGQLYHNNIASPLIISKGNLSLSSEQSWGELIF